MSWDARNWAYRQSVTSTTKFVLVTMGDRANDEHYYFQTLRKLSSETGINIKTIRRAINELLGLGLIKDTGQRCGRSGQVKIYALIGVPKTDWESQERRETTDAAVQ